MNLITFRQFFRKHSGRFDLVNSSFEDLGLDVFILAGQKYLDRLADIPSGVSRRIIDIEAGDWVVQFKNCRAVLDVWVTGPQGEGTQTRTPLELKTHKQLRGIDPTYGTAGYMTVPNALGTGLPLYYSPISMRLENSSSGQTGGLSGFLDLIANDADMFSGIEFFPPSDKEYSLEVAGHFYSEELVKDEDANFWSSQHPVLLYMSVMRQLEIIHRNTEGVKDWEASIQSEIITIDMDGVAQDSAIDTQMRG